MPASPAQGTTETGGLVAAGERPEGGAAGRPEAGAAGRTQAGAVGRRRAGRPIGGVLDKARITHAALELVEKKGYDGLTMAALARALNFAPSALYNHV